MWLTEITFWGKYRARKLYDLICTLFILTTLVYATAIFLMGVQNTWIYEWQSWRIVRRPNWLSESSKVENLESHTSQSYFVHRRMMFTTWLLAFFKSCLGRFCWNNYEKWCKKYEIPGSSPFAFPLMHRLPKNW